LCNKVNELGILAGKSPISIVAACIFLISALSKEPAAAKEIAETAGCTEGTLKNAYKTLLANREDLKGVVNQELFDFRILDIKAGV
jgi:transcription initiation factor TFIIB